MILDFVMLGAPTTTLSECTLFLTSTPLVCSFFTSNIPETEIHPITISDHQLEIRD